MYVDLILLPEHEGASRTPKRRSYRVVWSAVALGTIMLLKQDNGCEWSLPTWTTAPEQATWEALYEALVRVQRVEGIEVALAWLHASKQSVEEQATIGTLFNWLHAPSRIAPVTSYFTWRYPDARDAVAVAELVQGTQALTVAGARATLGATFDTTLAVFTKRWGTLLEACSIVVEARRSIAGVALTTLYGDVPLIALLATASPLIARDLLIMVCDALAKLHYPAVNVLLEPTSPYVALASALGFESVAQVQQRLIYS